MFDVLKEQLVNLPDQRAAGDTCPPPIPGRVLHIDGDFLAYQVSADDNKSFSDMQHNLQVGAKTLMLMAGAESYVLHITASSGNKGGRYETAVQKEYQCNRKGKAKPAFLEDIKFWMTDKLCTVAHSDQEADDGLAQAARKALDDGTQELAVITSKDKDLRIPVGWHMDWETGDLLFVEGYGSIELDRSGSSPKIVGYGPAYFWAQMLTGDPADSIVGLPLLDGETLNKYKPTAKILKARETLDNPKSSTDKVLKAQKVIDERPAGKCGPVIAYEILKDVRSNREAFYVVTDLYRRSSLVKPFVHWESGEEVAWKRVFYSEGTLLWMRRYKDPNDFKSFLMENLT